MIGTTFEKNDWILIVMLIVLQIPLLIFLDFKDVNILIYGVKILLYQVWLACLLLLIYTMKNDLKKKILMELKE